MTHLRQAPAGLADGPAAAVAEVVTLQLVTLLTDLRQRIVDVERHIADALAAHADRLVFTSLPWSGTVRAATLLAEIGDSRGRYASEEVLAAAAGVSPSTRASGKRLHVVMFRHGRVIWRCWTERTAYEPDRDGGLQLLRERRPLIRDPNAMPVAMST